MKTIRTILATFGVTTLLYGAFALVMMQMNPSFTGRSIFQLFRETGFITLVIGVGCVLAAVIMTIAIVSFRDEGSRKKHEILDEEDELDEFLEEETVPEERAAEADETWSSEIKRKQRKALRHTDEDEDEGPYEFYSEEEPESRRIPIRQAYGEQRPVLTQTPVRPAYREQRPAAEQAPVRSVYREETVAAEKKPVIRSSFRSAEEKTSFAFRPAGSTEGDHWDRPAAAREVTRERYPEPEAEAPAAEPEPGTQKTCPHCGELIDEDSAFCIFCGKRV